MQIFLRQYGTSGTCDFNLFSTDGATILTSASFSSGTCLLSFDDGTSANSTNLPSQNQHRFILNLTSSELTAKRIHIKLVDTNINKSWLDTSFVVETYGTSASMHGNIASGLLYNLVDTVAIRDMFTEMLAQLTGDFTRSGDAFTYLLRDRSTTSHTLSANPNQRSRV